MPPQRLPIVNSDDGTWGDILRQYLQKEHYDTGADNAANGGHKTITIRAGTASAGTAPLKFTSGTLLSSIEAGAMEYNGGFYLTDASARRQIITDTGTQTLTNKTIDANGAGNSITNLEVADFASGVIDTDLTSVSASDDTLPSAKATKTALDGKRAAFMTGTIATAAATAAKTVTLNSPWATYTPVAGDMFLFTYTSGTTVASVTVAINGGSALAVRIANAAASATPHTTAAGGVLLYYFDGTNLHLIGSQRNSDSNTTYVSTPTTFTTVAGTSQTAAVNNAYLANNASQVVFTLPATAAVGEVVVVSGLGAGGWRINAPAGDTIRVDATVSAAAGYIASNNQYDSVRLMCIVANTDWVAVDYSGLVSVDGTVALNPALIDEDSFATDTNRRAPTQQSAKTYIATQINTVPSALMTLTNKTIDANGTGNSITNLEVADFAGSAIVTSAEGLASSDNNTSIPTTAAVIDAIAAGGGSTFSDATFTVQDNSDVTKQMQFQLSGIATATTRTLTVPDASMTLVGTDINQTITNKILDTTNTYQVADNGFDIRNSSDATRRARFSTSSVTAGQTRVLTVPDANTTLVGTDTTQILSGKTLTAPRIANAGFIADANGNEQIIFTTTASAVNEITIANAASGANPTISATGGGTDVGLNFQMKGNASYGFLGTSSAPAQINLFEDTDNGTNRIGLVAPASIASNRIVTLPDASTTLIGNDTTDTLTNKTFNANGTGNSITNLEVADFAAGVIDADLSSVSASDDTIPSAKATKAALDAKQSIDATLTALATYNTNGILTQTATDTFTGRTITGTTNQVSVSNGDGVAGNPTLSLPQDIHTGASPQFAGINVGNASDTTITRTGAGAIAVEGVGVALNSTALTHTAGTIELGNATDTTLARGGAGRLTVEGVNVLTSSSTDTLTNKTFNATDTGNALSNIGTAHFAGSALVTEAEGLNSSDNDTSIPTTAAVKNYVDSNVPVTSNRQSVRASTTSSETYTISAGSVTQIAGTTVDGVSMSIGDRVLIKDAPAATGAGSANSVQPGNGIYTVTNNVTNLTVARAADMAGSNGPLGAHVSVIAGSTFAGFSFAVTTPSASGAFTYGSGSIAFSTGLPTVGAVSTGSATFTNKTISVDNNTISGIAASSFVLSNGSGNIDGSAAQKAIPSGVVVGTTDTQTLSAKTINLSNNTLTGTTAQFNTALSDGDFATIAGTETITGKTISADNNTLSGIAASSFVLSNGSGNIDGSAAQKAIPSGVVVGTTDTQTLSGKTISLASNTITGTTAQFNTALSDGDFATTAGVETLTNKTVNDDSFTLQDGADNTKKIVFSLGSMTTASTITVNAPNVTSGSHTMVVRNSTDTLENKSMSGDNNTFTNIYPESLDNVTDLMGNEMVLGGDFQTDMYWTNAFGEQSTEQSLVTSGKSRKITSTGAGPTVDRLGLLHDGAGNNIGMWANQPRTHTWRVVIRKHASNVGGGNILLRTRWTDYAGSSFTTTSTYLHSAINSGSWSNLVITHTTTSAYRYFYCYVEMDSVPAGDVYYVGSASIIDNSGGVTPTATQTLTNKRITARVTSIASSATPILDTDVSDMLDITALATNITSMTSSLSGTPTNGQKLMVRIKDNGTARTIAWGTSFQSSGSATLLASTVISKEHNSLFVYSTTVAKWVCIAVDPAGY